MAPFPAPSRVNTTVSIGQSFKLSRYRLIISVCPPFCKLKVHHSTAAGQVNPYSTQLHGNTTTTAQYYIGARDQPLVGFKQVGIINALYINIDINRFMVYK